VTASLFSLIRSAAKSLNNGSLFCLQIIGKTSPYIVDRPLDCLTCKGTECTNAASPSPEKAHTNSFFFSRDILKVSENKCINVKKYSTDLCKLDLDPVVADWQVVNKSNIYDILLFEC
jgi:hypothetical protein